MRPQGTGAQGAGASGAHYSVIESKQNEPIRILFVCLGNICRSPTAEGVLRGLCAVEAPGIRIEIDSAGTADYHLGKPPDPRSQRAAAARGFDLSSLRARRVERQDFAHFDVILAMDRSNLRALRALSAPGSRARVELFLEFAGGAADGDVPDPYSGNAADFERVLDIVIPACRRLIARLQQRSQ
jgi:protein-tyrosine phosphatase